ncbi:MAG: MATE family efflux transporter [Nevskia sp.]|nr:MATE family efflux transporter [Nevskia sp.]
MTAFGGAYRLGRASDGRLRQIWQLALPIIGALASQIVLNLVDTAMVGHLGAAALAAVGLGSFLNFMAFSTVTGLSTAVQALAARRQGEGRHEVAAVPLNGGILLSAAIGLPLSASLIALAPWLCARLNHDPEVARLGAQYLRLRLVAVVAIGINFSFRGYWSAVKRSAHYLRTLLLMCVLNIVLDRLLIFGSGAVPALGVRGAGLASMVSALSGTAAYFSLGWRSARGAGFAQRLPTPQELAALLRLGLPSCAQQLLFSAGFVALFWIVGRIGTAELAVAQVLVNITLAAVLPAMGFGLAAATFCSQALGRGDPADAYRWAWDVFRTSWWVFGALALVMLLLPRTVLGLFVGGGPAGAALIEIGVAPLRLVGTTVLLDGLGMVLMQALLGAGASAAVMRVSVGMQWGVFLPLAWTAATLLHAGLTQVWLLLAAYRAAQTLIFTWLWRGRGWSRARL